MIMGYGHDDSAGKQRGIYACCCQDESPAGERKYTKCRQNPAVGKSDDKPLDTVECYQTHADVGDEPVTGGIRTEQPGDEVEQSHLKQDECYIPRCRDNVMVVDRPPVRGKEEGDVYSEKQQNRDELFGHRQTDLHFAGAYA